jgi:hypothetical protein
MTVTWNRWRLVACALLALAAVCALGPGCDLNPQPLPPSGSGFSTGGNPVVTPEMDATTASSSGGSSSGGGLELSSDGAAGGRDGSPAPEGAAENPSDGEAGEAGAFVDAETDAPSSDGETSADSAYDAPEGE